MPAPHLNRPLISVERLWRAAPLALPVSQKAFRFLLRGCSEAAGGPFARTASASTPRSMGEFMLPGKSSTNGGLEQADNALPTLPPILQVLNLGSALYRGPSPATCRDALETHTCIGFSFFPISLYPLASPRLLLPGITFQLSFLHPNPCLRLCFQGNPN